MHKRTALITGASGGIGQAIAKRFIEDGYQTILHYHSNKEPLEHLKKEMESKGYKDIRLLQIDLSSSEDVEDKIKKLKEENKTIDVLINNAGVKEDALAHKMTDEQFERIIHTNVMGTFYITRRIIPFMRKQKYGRIINISSGLAQHGGYAKLNYGASKAAIENMTKNLAVELGPFGITVNTVAPGLIETDMTKNVTEKEKDAYRKKIPIRRLVEAKDVAHACAFFADEQSGSISNQVIGVNGGLR
jgi:3-oxoacyl-[acyl-carrier protein] reductase